MSPILAILNAHRAAIDSLDPTQIEACGNLIVATLKAGRTLFLCGNGGSASDAQHIATEITCRFETTRRGLPAIALTTDTSALTAIGNDFGFERIFSRQVEALARPGDCLIGITTSGSSPNVVAAVSAAKAMGVTTLGLVGRDGGVLNGLCDHALIVPAHDTARIQECHILIGHIWCAMIDAAFA
ncbi:MAG: SIS domain-containing protein [Betaproteobacteria bacterium]|nr:MAG: SIS domain-containing protein [Betaproteobacteria bacterium]